MANIETEGKKKEKQANHFLLAQDGSRLPSNSDWEKAVGVEYESINPKESFKYRIPLPESLAKKGVTIADLVGTPLLMGSLFGYRTRAVNTASQNRNSDTDSGISDVAAIAEAFGGIKDGDWNASRGGGVGYDYDKLAEAIGIVKKRAKQPFDLAGTKNRLEKEEGYTKAVMSVPDVKAEYGRLTAKGGKTIDDI